MKKTLLVGFGAAAIIGLAGCAMPPQDHTGFPTVSPGLWISDIKTPQFVQDKALNKGYTVVKNVEAKTSSKNICAIYAEGGATYAELKAQMLANVKADDVIDIEVESQRKNLLVVQEVFVTVRGKAIKYNK